MQRTIKKLAGLLVAATLMLSLTQCTKNKTAPNNDLEGTTNKSMNKSKTYLASLSALNQSGVSGTATLTLNGDQLTVMIEAMGLEPNMLHPQHIHGHMDNKGNATCPTMSADTNGNGLVEIGEGLPFYGPVLLPLEAFPTADADGMIHYMHTFTITKDLLPLQNRVIVLHGMTVNESYWATLPVACGQIKPANGHSMMQ